MHLSSTESNKGTESYPNGNTLQSGQVKFRMGSEFMWLKPVFNSWITKLQLFLDLLTYPEHSKTWDPLLSSTVTQFWLFFEGIIIFLSHWGTTASLLLLSLGLFISFSLAHHSSMSYPACSAGFPFLSQHIAGIYFYFSYFSGILLPERLLLLHIVCKHSALYLYLLKSMSTPLPKYLGGADLG